MTGEELNALYGAMISPDARVDIPTAWEPAVHEAMMALYDLPSAVRMFVIVMSITKEDGSLTFSIAAATDYMTDDGVQRLHDIVGRAQDAVAKLEVLH